MGGGVFKISDFIGSNPGDLPLGGGIISVIIDGNLVVDVDYSFAPGSHVLLTNGSSISVDDLLAVPNLNSPKLIFDGTTISSCGNDRWSFIRALDEFSEINFINGTIVKDGSLGVFIGQEAGITATDSRFSDFLFSCISLGSLGTPYLKSIDATIVNNIFELSPFGLRILNTEPISIGEGNIFRLPITTSSISRPIAIYVISSSVSLSSGNDISGFETGILSHNDSQGFRFLNCSGITISDCMLAGIDIRADN